MSDEERQRIQSMERVLPVQQQELIKVQLNNYRNSLVIKGIPKANIDSACHVFWKTLVTKLFGASAASVLSKQTAPPPPPATKRPPTAHPLRASAAGSVFQLVDKSNGLLARLMPGSSLPVGLQDWVNRVFLAAEKRSGPPAVERKKAETFVTETLRGLVQKGEFWTTNWIAVPAQPPEIVIDLEPATKTRKVVQAQDFIAVSAPVKKTKRQSIEDEELTRRRERAMKYKDHLRDSSGGLVPASPETTAEVNVNYEFGNDEEDVFEKTGQYSVVGTCKSLEKRYLRLTSAPDPTLVRPEPVLKKWLSELQRLWTSRSKDWKYIEDQMRAIRQDLTVQNLRGPFTRHVYELNARWALEGSDLGQFNQCQTQLRQLHEASTDELPEDVRVEFLAYRLLYYTLQNLRVDEQIFLSKVLGDTRTRAHPFMQFALKMRSASITSNFSLYFRLSKQARRDGQKVAPSHAQYLLRLFETKQRMLALLVFTKAIATPITVTWLTELLGFDSEDDCRTFLSEHEAVMKSPDVLDPKASHQVFAESPLLLSSKLKLMG
jgi:hypothetical protein